MKQLAGLLVIVGFMTLGGTVTYLILTAITDMFNFIFPELLGMEYITKTQMVLLILFTIVFKKLTL